MTKFHDFVQEAVIKTIPKKKKCKKANWLSQEALQIAEKKKEKWKAKENRRIYPSEGRIPKNSKERFKKKKKILPQGSMQRKGKQ